MRVPAGRSTVAERGGGVCGTFAPLEAKGDCELPACCVDDLHPPSERAETRCERGEGGDAETEAHDCHSLWEVDEKESARELKGRRQGQHR